MTSQHKQNFMLKVALIWTINDFLAYGMLSGWMMQGKLACSIYIEDTKAFTLKYRKKNYRFDYHRRVLNMAHTYRCSRYGFRKNIKNEETPIRLIGQHIWETVCWKG